MDNVLGFILTLVGIIVYCTQLIISMIKSINWSNVTIWFLFGLTGLVMIVGTLWGVFIWM
jgi:hypothetical protein